MNRPGLFQRLIFRTLILVAGAIAIQIAASYFLLGEWLYGRWQADLGEEAAWVAAHTAPDMPARRLAEDWAERHHSVRLTLLDAKGNILAGPAPVYPGHKYSILIGQAPITLAEGAATLLLSRDGRPAVPLHPEFLLLMAILVTLGAILLYPLVRTWRRDLGRLSALADRVAGGHFGETMEPPSTRELADLTNAFNDMSGRLRDGELRQMRLVADVSHELRSPMGRLRALIETIGRHPEEARAHLGPMDAEIALMDRLVGDMLDMARLDAGKVELTRKPTPLGSWVEDAFARNRRRIAQAGIAGQDEIRLGDLALAIDPQRLVQALGNLVDNAVAASAQRIDLTASATPGDWRIAVSDDGTGIPDADIPYVFDRFYRAERHRSRRTGGAGLGLSITKAIVEAHGGRIHLDSAEGRGATVTLIFPTDS